MVENRGRPSEQVIKLDKWVLDTNDSTWYYDKSKSNNGCWKIEQKFTKGEHSPKPKIDQRLYHKNCPTVVVFKTSNRSNAKTKIKVWRNENIDWIITQDKLAGVPSNAEILELGVGTSFIEEYKSKYKLK